MKDIRIKVSTKLDNNSKKIIDISDLSDIEERIVLGSLRGNGTYWIRIVNGRLEYFPYYEPLPSPVLDEEMLPFWRKATKSEMDCTYSLLEMDKLDEDDCSRVSISFHSVCGLSYTPGNYKEEINKLISYGFECLRSRRQEEGKFLEIWCLESISLAKGELKNHISVVKENEMQLKLALGFLKKNIKFGSLEVSVQKIIESLE